MLKVWKGLATTLERGTCIGPPDKSSTNGRVRCPRPSQNFVHCPGVGPYIANAIASLAFQAPVLALEANGIRVAARLTLERGDVRKSRVRARLATALTRHLPRDRSGIFNEALMELGGDDLPSGESPLHPVPDSSSLPGVSPPKAARGDPVLLRSRPACARRGVGGGARGSGSMVRPAAPRPPGRRDPPGGRVRSIAAPARPRRPGCPPRRGRRAPGPGCRSGSARPTPR